MKRSLRRMLGPRGEKEPQGVVYQGVDSDMDDSKDSFKVPWAIGCGDGEVRAEAGFALRGSRFQPRRGRAAGLGRCAVRAGPFSERGGPERRLGKAATPCRLRPVCLPAG